MRIYRIRKFPTRLFLIFLIAAFILANRVVKTGLKDFAFRVLTKPINALSGATSYFKRAKKLSDENLLLKQRIASLSIDLARMKEGRLENERLHSLLGFKKSLGYNAVISKVIARDPADWRSSIIINKGAGDGIKKHTSVATAEGFVGSVVEAGPSSSRVMLITDPDSRVGVVIEPSRETGVLIGSSEGECRVIYLSLDAKIERGDEARTGAFSAFFPEGLPVGKVKEIGLERTGLYKYAVIDPVRGMGSIEEVVCIVRD